MSEQQRSLELSWPLTHGHKITAAAPAITSIFIRNKEEAERSRKCCICSKELKAFQKSIPCRLQLLTHWAEICQKPNLIIGQSRKGSLVSHPQQWGEKKERGVVKEKCTNLVSHFPVFSFILLYTRIPQFHLPYSVKFFISTLIILVSRSSFLFSDIPLFCCFDGIYPHFMAAISSHLSKDTYTFSLNAFPLP